MALRGHPGVSAPTRERLRALAWEMGYRPNPLIAANMVLLRAGRRSAYTGTLAFVGNGAPPDLNSPAHSLERSYVGAQRRAEALGYRLEWFSLGKGVTGRRLGNILKARGVCGVVLGANELVPSELQMDWSAFALAAIGRTEIGHDLHRTTGDYYQAVRGVCQICRARGYRRIGLSLSRDHDAAHHGLHHSAFVGCQIAWPAADRVPALIANEWTEASFFAWLREHEPDVVIAGDDDFLPAWFARAGVRIPQDLGFVRPHVGRPELGIAGFLFHDEGIGAAAIDLVAEQLDHNERGLPEVVKLVLLPGRWFEGRSLRPAAVDGGSATLIRSPR